MSKTIDVRPHLIHTIQLRNTSNTMDEATPDSLASKRAVRARDE